MAVAIVGLDHLEKEPTMGDVGFPFERIYLNSGVFNRVMKRMVTNCKKSVNTKMAKLTCTY